jgi:hypothetical protein
MERSVRRGQPIRFFPGPRRVLLNLKRQRSIFSILKCLQHCGILVCYQWRTLPVIPRERPNRLCGGELYHHIGIPTDVPQTGEYYLAQFKMYVSVFETSPCGIQWMRFEPDSPVHPLTKVPHISFEVDDLQVALKGKEILTPPNSPSEDVTVAMILDRGAPVGAPRISAPRLIRSV